MAGFSFSTRKSSSWAVARRRFRRAEASVEGRQWQAVRRAALLAERELKKGIVAGAPGGQTLPALRPTTILLKGSSKPLIDRGQQGLLGSVTHTFDRRRKAAFVGVHRTAKGSEGEPLFNVALIQEFGTKPFVIPVTPAVRRLFWFLHFASGGAINPLSPNTTEIAHPGVPARPFMRPTFEAIRPKVVAIVGVALTENGGPF